VSAVFFYPISYRSEFNTPRHILFASRDGIYVRQIKERRRNMGSICIGFVRMLKSSSSWSLVKVLTLSQSSTLSRMHYNGLHTPRI